MWQDPIVEEIHKIRETLAAQFQYDVQALGKFFQAQQAAEHRVVVTRAPRRMPEAAQSPSPTPDQGSGGGSGRPDAPVAPYLPTYHYGQLAWSAVGAASEPVATSLTWLAAYTVLFLALAVRGYRREEQQKFE